MIGNSQPNKLKISEITTYVDGWLFPNEALALAEFAANARDNIVEIGSYRGRSTIVLAMWSEVPVYAIDPHIPSIGEDHSFGNDDREIWTRNVVRYGVYKNVRPINLTSKQVSKVWCEPVDLLFIDGSHDYQSVTEDLLGWIPHLTPDAIIAMHDANDKGVNQAITDCKHLELLNTIDLTKFFKLRT